MKTKPFIVYLCFCLILFSCVSETKITDTINLDVIPYNAYNGIEMDVDKYISVEDTTVLHIGDHVISYNVEDACMDDSTIYILDEQKNILAFDSKTGLMKCAIGDNVGHGRGEYIKPHSICVSGGILYLLDVSGNAILQYDKNLKFIKKIKLDFSLLDFLKIEGGFVLYDISIKDNEDVLSIVVIDENGVEKNRYSFYHGKFPEQIITSKVFVRTDKGVFFLDIVSDMLYELQDNNVSPIAKIKDEKSVNKDCKILRSFPLTNTIITHYISENHRMDNIYDKKTIKSISGIFKSPNPYAIFPYIEKNGFLYGIYRQHNDDNQYILTKFRINN